MAKDIDKTDAEILTPSQRWGGLATVVAMLFVLGFFALHQWMNTGFLTGRFGQLEALCLYGPILISLAAPIVRAWTGRQNPSRPFDAATNLSLALGSLWLAIVFPFDFGHLADILPEMIRFVIAWITNDFGRLVLIVQVIIGVIIGPLTIMQYMSMRSRATTA